MYSFRRFGNSDDPWFRIGNLDVSTTLFVVGLGVISMFVWALEGSGGPLLRNLILFSDGFVGNGSVLEGQVWRLVTWPIPNEPDIWRILLLVILFQLGSQLEGLMGRKPFAWFLGLLTVVPAVVVTLVELATGIEGGASGLRFIELGVLVAFAAQYPNAQFFFGIPAWGIAGVIVVLDGLQIIGNRDEYSLVMWVCMLLVGLVGFRSFGYAESLHQVPRVPLPSFMTGAGVAASPRRHPSAPSRGSRRRRSGLRIVPPPDPAADRQADMEIDALLDQVASQGLDSLTRAQRKRLEQHSRELRRRRDQR